MDLLSKNQKLRREIRNYCLNTDGMTLLLVEPEFSHEIGMFGCHISHANTVRLMLRGAKGQCRPIGSNQAWSDCNLGVKGEWSDRFWYVSDKFESRIVEEK